MKNVVTGLRLLADLTFLKASGAPYENPKLILITNAEDIPATAALADVDVADFTGYATSSAVTWGTNHLDDEGNAVCRSVSKEFKPSADGPAVTVNHVGLVSNDGATLLRTARIDPSFTFTTTQDVLTISFPLTMSQPAESPESVAG